MKFNLLYVFALCSIIFSCNIEPVDGGDVAEEPTNTDNVLLKKEVWTLSYGDVVTINYNYNGDKLISVVGTDGSEEWKNVYTYDSNDNLIKDDYFDVDGHIASITLEYDSNDKLVSYLETFFETSGLSDRTYKYVFTYNNDGTIDNKVYVNYSNTGFELLWPYTIILEENNISEIVDNNDGFKISYTYDDKNGAYKNIHAIEVLNLLSENEFGARIHGSTHNMVSFVESGPGSNFYDTVEYTYNENNYPKTSTYKSKYDGRDSFQATIEYFYE